MDRTLQQILQQLIFYVSENEQLRTEIAKLQEVIKQQNVRDTDKSNEKE